MLEEPNGKPLVKRLLKELAIPEASQVLVFTKTSLQRRVVNPKNPRAIYFDEDVYLGWMPGGRIEITSMDPDVGGIFYFQRPLTETKGPLFQREESCLGCHAGSATNFLPGLLARSVYPDENGRNLKSVNTFERVGHHVPFEERWGGWYVTGFHGKARHLGNALATGGRSAPVMQDEKSANRESLDDFFPADIHLRKGSDLLALMLLDHQISMHHWIMEAHYRVRTLLHEEGVKGPSNREQLQSLDEDAGEELERCLNKLVRYLLFADEAALSQETWRGSAEYQDTFLADRRQDPKGRSLKDLRLRERLFHYRCSYMIYSKAFTALPGALKEEVFHRLRQILTGKQASEGFDYFESAEREAIAEILVATLPDLAAYWKSSSSS